MIFHAAANGADLLRSQGLEIRVHVRGIFKQRERLVIAKIRPAPRRGIAVMADLEIGRNRPSREPPRETMGAHAPRAVPRSAVAARLPRPCPFPARARWANGDLRPEPAHNPRWRRLRSDLRRVFGGGAISVSPASSRRARRRLGRVRGLQVQKTRATRRGDFPRGLFGSGPSRPPRALWVTLWVGGGSPRGRVGAGPIPLPGPRLARASSLPTARGGPAGARPHASDPGGGATVSAPISADCRVFVELLHRLCPPQVAASPVFSVTSALHCHHRCHSGSRRASLRAPGPARRLPPGRATRRWRSTARPRGARPGGAA